MATELRVHGVSGSPVEQVLDRPLVERVAGDDDAGFFRPKREYGALTGPGDATLEGYRWGNLTAGAAARALWLLLLPFMLANVALWLRPPGQPRAAYRILCRLFAATMTATFVLGIVGLSVDLVAWQCAAPDNPCATSRSWLSFLAHGFFAPTGRRLAVLAVVPIVAIGVLWYLGARTWSRYEGYQGTSDVDGEGLNAPGFWRGKPLVGRLRAIHLGIGFGTVDAVLLGVLVPHDHWVAGWILAGITGALLLLALVALTLKGMVDRDRPAGWAPGYARWLRIGAVLLTIAVLGYAMWPRAAWLSTGGLPGYGLTITILFAAQIGVLLILAAVSFAQCCPGQYLRGLGGPIVASLGLAVAAAFAAGASFRVADYLDRSATPVGRASAARLQPPAALQWSAFGMVVTVLVVALVALGTRLYLIPKLRAAAKSVADGDFTPAARTGNRDRAATIDNAIADSKLIDHSGALLLWG